MCLSEVNQILFCVCCSYGLEGPGTTCSVQWQQRSAAARSYIGCLFTFCLLLPLLLMVFCYGRILLALRAVARQVRGAANTRPLTSVIAVKAAGDCAHLQVSGMARSSERRDSRVLLMVVSMVTGYLLCWLPYGVVAMLASFGRPGALPPAASLIPSLLAKSSTVLNPVIYVLLNNQVTTVIRWRSDELSNSTIKFSFVHEFGPYMYRNVPQYSHTNF